MSSVTAHCLIKNEEIFVGYAIRSVINFVDKIIIFDTGSTDQTVEIIKNLIKKYPDKIIFEEKGECDKARHTQLRQEMLERTKTDWFMILDGDEIWTKRGVEEALAVIANQPTTECVVAPFYLCVGDIYHTYAGKKRIKILGKTDFHYPRFIKIIPGLHWQGDYNQDTLLDKENKEFCKTENSRFLSNKYWHLTHLVRSSHDDHDYSSGGSRKAKRRLTYFVIGKKIKESVPEVLLHNESEAATARQNKNDFRMSFLTSFVNFLKLIFASVNKLS